MPVIDGHGFSDATDAKQEDLRYILTFHLRVAARMIASAASEGRTFPPPDYWYFDITAGKGRHPTTGDPGSPLIFLEVARAEGAVPRTWFFEQDPANFAELQAAVKTDARTKLVLGDHAETLMPEIPAADRPRLGLLYCDTTGNVPPFELLRTFAEDKRTKRIDLLLNVPCTTLKRTYGAHAEKGARHLHEYLSDLPKTDWLIREPHGQHQWSFFVGTNWAEFPAFKNRGFYKLGTPEGDELLRRLTYSEREREDQPLLKL